MTDKHSPTPDVRYDYDLVFDKTECGNSGGVSYGLLTDFHSPADILIRWPHKGFSHYAEGAQETAEALAAEVVHRWNTHAAHKEAVAELVEALVEIRAIAYTLTYGDGTSLKPAPVTAHTFMGICDRMIAKHSPEKVR
ncbi:MAG: hypothetical protein WC091_02550 [Sulfuricellaceae bacterium]